MENKLDRRIQRTRKLLFDALLDLILEKGYEAVTVQHIIDRASVGRSTFYAHFENKDQLLYGSHQALNRLLFSTGDNTTEKIDFLTLYTHAQQHSHVAQAMLGKKGGKLVIGYFRDAMSFKILSEMKKTQQSEKNEMMLSFTAEATAAALSRLLTYWLDQDMPFTVEEMAQKSQKLYATILQTSL